MSFTVKLRRIVRGSFSGSSASRDIDPPKLLIINLKPTLNRILLIRSLLEKAFSPLILTGATWGGMLPLWHVVTCYSHYSDAASGPAHAAPDAAVAVRCPDFIFEVKWDGFRALAVIEHGHTS